MKKINLILFLLLVLSSITFALANIETGEETIKTKYAKNSYLSGGLEIAFENQNIESILTDSFENSISLETILKNNSNYKYNCSTKDCKKTYEAKNEFKSKTFTLNSNEEKVFGFYLTGQIDLINSAEFSISSTAPQSNQNQLKIDILNDGEYEAGNTQAGSQISTFENDGCFDDDERYEKAALTSIPYCQKISLNEAPGFLLGAWVEEELSGDANITMTMYDEYGVFLSECNLPKNQISSTGKEVYCSVNTLVPQKNDYYICVSLREGSGEYKIKAYTGNDESLKCGFRGAPVKDPTGSYKIITKSKNFASFSNMKINNTLPTGDEMSQIIEDYLFDKYGTLDCSLGCIIPIKFSSFVDQEITIDQILLQYDKLSASGIDLEYLNELELENVLINSEKQELILDNQFKMPDKNGNFSYELKLDGEEILSKDIRIESITLGIDIKKTAQNYPTTFTARTNSLENIKEFRWDFGDNQTQETFSNQATHTYSQIGNYTLKLTIVDLDNIEFTKEFQITVKPVKELVSQKIQEYETSLSNLEKEIQKLDIKSQKVIKEEINLTLIKQKIEFLKEKQSLPQSDETDQIMISTILELSIPESIFQSKTKQVPFFAKKESIDLDAIYEQTQTIPQEGQEDDAKSQIVFWAQKNLNTKVSLIDIMVKKEGIVETKAKIFEITISPKDFLEDEYFVYVTDSEEIQLKETEYEEITGYKVISSLDQITFSLIGSQIELEDLPIFIAPKITSLSLTEDIKEEEKDDRWTLFAFIVLGLILLGVLAYVILHRWYKVKYEKYLFKDRKNLYNVMIYVNNAKKQGTPNDIIKQNLRKSGWSQEQIRYIMRKYEGKNTGMYSFSGKTLKKEKDSDKNKQIPNKNPIKMATNFNQKPNRGNLGPGYKI